MVAPLPALRRTIAVDLDEVLGGFLPALIRYHNDTFATRLRLEDFFSYRFADVWGGTNAAATEKIYRFFDTDYFHHGISPLPSARQVLQKCTE